MEKKQLDTLYDLCETVYKELDMANEKIKSAGGEVSGGDVEFLDRLTHILKNIKTSIAMCEEDMMDEGSSGYYDGRYLYNDMSMDNGRGGMYARGGRSGARGGRSNSYARSGREGSYARGGRSGRYTRDNAREDFMGEIEELMEKAPDERTRQKFERFMAEMN